MTRRIGLIIALLSVSLAPAFANAQWSAPGATPPGSNASTPVNVSATTQTKAGTLVVGSIGSAGGGYFLGNFGVGMSNPSNKLDVNGNVGATAYYYTSDKNLKKDIKPLSGALESILKLEGVSFTWKKTGEKSIGLVAQQVEQVYPELVSTNPNTGMKSVEYGNIVAPLIEAIKAQQRQIDELKAEVRALKNK